MDPLLRYIIQGLTPIVLSSRQRAFQTSLPACTAPAGLHALHHPSDTETLSSWGTLLPHYNNLNLPYIRYSSLSSTCIVTVIIQDHVIRSPPEMCLSGFKPIVNGKAGCVPHSPHYNAPPSFTHHHAHAITCN